MLPGSGLVAAHLAREPALARREPIEHYGYPHQAFGNIELRLKKLRYTDGFLWPISR
jgi:hypothetical protein